MMAPQNKYLLASISKSGTRNMQQAERGTKEITDSLFPSKGCYLASKALRKYGDTLS